MKNDWKEIARWAVLSGVLVFASIGARTAWSGVGNAGARPAMTVNAGGCEYKLDLVADRESAVVKGTLEVTNQGGESQTLNMHVASVDRTFKGSLLSRVQRPSDFSEAEVQTKDFKVDLGPSASKTLKFQLKFNAPKAPMSTTAPMIAVSVGGKRVMLSALHLPRPEDSPK